MDFYIAAPWSLRALARSLGEKLEMNVAEVTSRWHKRTYIPPQDLGTCAIHDSEDIDTEPNSLDGTRRRASKLVKVLYTKRLAGYTDRIGGL